MAYHAGGRDAVVVIAHHLQTADIERGCFVRGLQLVHTAGIGVPAHGGGMTHYAHGACIPCVLHAADGGILERPAAVDLGAQLRHQGCVLSGILSGVEALCLGRGMGVDEDALYELNEIILWVHQEMQKNVWIYTGYVYEDLLKEIENNPNTDRSKALRAILNSVDVLVDGPFIEEKKDFSCPFRGSSNQRILYLKDGKNKQ